MRALILLSALALLHSGCSEPMLPHPEGSPAIRAEDASGVVFQADRTGYSHGDTAKIVLRNETDATIGYNLCTSARELRGGSGWKRYETLRLCAAAFFNLAPGEEAVLSEPITREWQPGEYRMVTTINMPARNAHGEVFTPSFTVKR